MRPLPHEGACPSGPPPDGLLFVTRFAQRLPLALGDAALAFVSATAREAVHQQVVASHRLAEWARRQSAWRARLHQRALPEGPWREAASLADRLEDVALDAWTRAALNYGRAFGRKAFAFPLPGERT